MKFFIVLFALIGIALAAPQFFPGGGFSGSNAQAGASSFGGGGFGGGFSGSNAQANAGSFSGGFGGPFGGFSGANANAGANSFGFGK